MGIAGWALFAAYVGFFAVSAFGILVQKKSAGWFAHVVFDVIDKPLWRFTPRPRLWLRKHRKHIFGVLAIAYCLFWIAVAQHIGTRLFWIDGLTIYVLTKFARRFEDGSKLKDVLFGITAFGLLHIPACIALDVLYPWWIALPAGWFGTFVFILVMLILIKRSKYLRPSPIYNTWVGREGRLLR